MSSLSTLDIGKLKIKSAATAEERKRKKVLKNAPPPTTEAPPPEDFRKEDLGTPEEGLFRSSADEHDKGEDVAVGESSLGFLGSSSADDAAIDDLLVGSLLERETPNSSSDALFERTTARTKAPTDLADDGLDDDVFSRLEDATKDDDDDGGGLPATAAKSPVADEETKEAPLITDDFDYEAYIASQAVSTGGGLFED